MHVYKSLYPPTPLPESSIFTHVLPAQSSLNPDSAAFIDGVTGRIITRRQFRGEALAFAWGLSVGLSDFSRTNLKRGDRIMVFSPNDVAYPLIIFGAIAAGIQITYASSAYTPPEIVHQMRDTKPKYIFVHPTLLPVLLSAFTILRLSKSDATHRIILISPSAQSQNQPEYYLTLPTLLAHSLSRTPSSFKEQDFSGKKAHETIFIYYSSGTTGLPKGVELTHHNITSVMNACRSWGSGFLPGSNLEGDGKDVFIAVLPFYHVYGNAMVITFPLMIGVPAVIVPGFEPNLFLGCISRYRVTKATIIPPIALFLASSPLVDKYNLSSLKYLLIAAAPLSPELATRLKNRLDTTKGTVDVKILEGYGLTETSPSIAANPLKKPKIGRIGPLLPNLEARLVDDDGNDVGEGERGELWVRSPIVMKGYLNNPEATRNAITPDGWFKTGDIAAVDEDGYFAIVDRKKELIKYKGFQVPPAELEGVLISHPEIADAGVTAVYSNKEATELPIAHIVPKDSNLLKDQKKAAEFIEAIHAWVGKTVANHKQLRGGIIIVAAIPKSQSGKILRKDLRASVSARAEAPEQRSAKL